MSIHHLSTSTSSLSDGKISTSADTPENEVDLEKQDTITHHKTSPSLTPQTSKTSSHVRNSHSLARGNTNRSKFTHSLSHVKTPSDTIVDFEGPDDPYRPINWPFRKKLITTLVYGLTTMGSTWASSVYSTAVQQISDEYGVTQEVGTLGTSFLLLGFGLGPLLWAPLSEVYGRKHAVLIPYFVAACFSFGTAAAKDIQTVLITRFFAGIFASAPVTNTGGVLGDIWSPQQRGTAIVGYAFSVVAGPTIGPIAGAAIDSSYLGWRWTEYTTAIMMMCFFLLGVIVLDETYVPVLLVKKARRLRHGTGKWALHARHEEWNVSLREMANKFLKTPFRLLATPICFLMALYASFVYGILYLCLGAIPIQFAEERGWGPVTSQLPFLALLCGCIIGGGMNFLNNSFYTRRFEANDNKPVPEARLPPMMIGSLLFTTSLFLFGWTSSSSTTPIWSLFALILLGIGFFTICQAALNYLIDIFTHHAASAVAATTFLRSLFAATFPLFVAPMFHTMGIPWASSLLGFISLGMLPIPWLFWVYGEGIRERGRWGEGGS